MSIVNEAAQWAVLIFLGIFVLGLTRQLGAFLTTTRAMKADVTGPSIGKVVPRSLLSAEERRRLVDLIRGRGVDWAAILAVDDRCSGCDELIAGLEADGVPEGAPLFVFSRQSDEEHRRRLAAIADHVVVDERRMKRADLTITPFAMLVDDELRIARKAIGTELMPMLERWRAERDGTADPAQSNGHGHGHEHLAIIREEGA
jgi:hypothetical protein